MRFKKPEGYVPLVDTDFLKTAANYLAAASGEWSSVPDSKSVSIVFVILWVVNLCSCVSGTVFAATLHLLRNSA
jgi:hypothetical protein